jgi:glycosyl transferase family 1
LFTSLERLLSDDFDLLRMPYFPIENDPRAATVAALEVLSWADLCILSVPHHVNALDPLFLGRARMRRSIPFLYLPLGEFPRGARVYRQICHHLRSNDQLLFSSTADLDCWRSLVNSCPATAKVIPFGVDTNVYRPDPKQRRVFRAELRMPATHRALVYHGRQDPLKQTHTMIALFAEVARDFPQTEFWLAGETSDNLPIDRLMKALPEDIRMRIRWLGQMPEGDVPALLAAADAGVYLTLNPDENFGFAPLEAMACGLPIIAAAWGGLRDTTKSTAALQVHTMLTPVAPTLYLPQARAAMCHLLQAGQDTRTSATAVAHVRSEFSHARWRNEMAATIIEAAQADTTCAAETHAWTNFGAQFDRAHSNSEGRSSSLLPDSYLFGSAPGVDRLLGAYSSGFPPPRGPLCVTSMYLKVAQRTVHSVDPYYLFDAKQLSQEEADCLNGFIRAGANGLENDSCPKNVLKRLAEIGLLIGVNSTFYKNSIL